MLSSNCTWDPQARPPAGTRKPENPICVELLATTAAGDAYTLPGLSAMYREAGFADVSAHPVPTGPHTVVVGRAV